MVATGSYMLLSIYPTLGPTSILLYYSNNLFLLFPDAGQISSKPLPLTLRYTSIPQVRSYLTKSSYLPQCPQGPHVSLMTRVKEWGRCSGLSLRGRRFGYTARCGEVGPSAVCPTSPLRLPPSLHLVDSRLAAHYSGHRGLSGRPGDLLPAAGSPEESGDKPDNPVSGHQLPAGLAGGSLCQAAAQL